MTNKEIQQLINKYLEGETSPEEERQLAMELQGDNMPEEWQAIRLMLGELTMGEAESWAKLNTMPSWNSASKSRRSHLPYWLPSAPSPLSPPSIWWACSSGCNRHLK